ncbi:MAG: hypothetical protein JO019_00750 [Candidatus Kaiserbacteria bacterium]|nr:hypothetical protein [Candidatus Kaiserbacteria bacterium]
MHWQDIAISIAQWLSIIALFPTVAAKEKPALSSSILTTACIAVYSICYITLGLWISATSAALLALVWMLLGWQKWRQGKAVEMLK